VFLYGDDVMRVQGVRKRVKRVRIWPNGHQDDDRFEQPSTSRMVVIVEQVEEMSGKSTRRNSKLGHCIPL